MWSKRAIAQVAGRTVVVALLMVGVLAPPSQAAPSTFTVTNKNDSGAGSLRQAILDANANNNPGEQDLIDFNIPGTGVHTIAPVSSAALPTITEPVIIDGYTQPGSNKNDAAVGTNAKLLIELEGANLAALNEQGLVFETPNSVVKGLVINRFRDGGIVLSTASANTSVKGNFIGTNPDGTNGGVDLGNGQDGVEIASTAGNNNTIGGASPAARNIISENQLNGVEINTDDNAVVGNLIGTGRNGTDLLGNSSGGVRIGGDAKNNSVEGNTIAFTGGAGVQVYSSNATGNSILSNSIFSNNGLGIDLGGDGTTTNENKDPDSGPNDLQNKPNLTSAMNSSDTITVKGRLNSTPNRTFTLQFFANPPGTDEGKTFLGNKAVSTGQDGLVLFQKGFSPAVSKGRTVTATATDSVGNTSEFSGAREVTAS